MDDDDDQPQNNFISKIKDKCNNECCMQCIGNIKMWKSIAVTIGFLLLIIGLPLFIVGIKKQKSTAIGIGALLLLPVIALLVMFTIKKLLDYGYFRNCQCLACLDNHESYEEIV